MGSFRRRLIVTLIGLVALTALAVGTISTVLVERSLRAQLVADAVAGAEFNIGVLPDAVGLPADAGPDDVVASGLVDRFLIRGVDGAWVEFGDAEPVVSGISVVDGPAVVSDGLRLIVDRGELGYEFVSMGGRPVMVIGGRRPPTGPDFYFVYSAASIDAATRRLVTTMSAVSAGVALVGAAVAWVMGGRLLKPVDVARRAAERMAEGDLDVRLATTERDEFGRLAASFNQMAASLQETFGALERAQARERRFVADVTHELRTPLTSLVNSARMLAERLHERREVTDEDRVIAAMVDGEVGRMANLVEDLLEISRLDSDHAARPLVDLDLATFLADLVERRLPTAEVTVEGTQPVRVDRRALERIVGNLIDNAHLHGGAADVSLAASVHEGLLTVEVADRGPGVPESELDAIFDRFTMMDPARASGSGLGLAIAREQAQLLGGDIIAALRPGGGLSMKATIVVAEPLPDGDRAATAGEDDVSSYSKGDPS